MLRRIVSDFRGEKIEPHVTSTSYVVLAFEGGISKGKQAGWSSLCPRWAMSRSVVFQFAGFLRLRDLEELHVIRLLVIDSTGQLG